MDEKEMAKTLLERLSSGNLDTGLVGDECYTTGGSSIWMAIIKGIPMQLKEGPGSKFFNGKENETINGARHIVKQWSSDDEKLEFLQKFGWLLKDELAKAYSKLFKKTK